MNSKVIVNLSLLYQIDSNDFEYEMLFKIVNTSFAFRLGKKRLAMMESVGYIIFHIGN